jgi:hypothetical protein
LEQWLAAEAALETFKIDDPEDAASVLLFSTAGDYLLGLLLRSHPRPSAEQVAVRIHRARLRPFFHQAI